MYRRWSIWWLADWRVVWPHLKKHWRFFQDSRRLPGYLISLPLIEWHQFGYSNWIIDDGFVKLIECLSLVHNRNYAKRQLCWFRNEDKFRWLNASLPAVITKAVSVSAQWNRLSLRTPLMLEVPWTSNADLIYAAFLIMSGIRVCLWTWNSLSLQEDLVASLISDYHSSDGNPEPSAWETAQKAAMVKEAKALKTYITKNR